MSVLRAEESRRANQMHGLSRTLVNNMVVGVSEGFTKQLRWDTAGPIFFWRSSSLQWYCAGSLEQWSTRAVWMAAAGQGYATYG